jgi:diguanylate cyclase (GGDEF)-like protein
LVSAPASSAGWAGGIGPAPVAAALAALLLLAFAGLNLRASHNEMRRASLYDELTGLPNRRLLGDRLQSALQLGGRRSSSCAVLLLDLDRFKEVNDTLGHHYGDLLLCEVAARLGTVVRSSDTVARLGSDEFAVLLTDVIGLEDAHALAERCLVQLHEPFAIEGVTLSIEASIGLALAPQDGDDDAPSCGRPTSRCTRRRSASTASWRTSRDSTCTRPAGWPCSATCAGRWAATSWSCTTSPRSTSAAAGAQRGGAGPLAAPGSRAAAAQPVHRRGRGHRPDPAAHPAHPRAGRGAGARLVRRRQRDPGRGQLSPRCLLEVDLPERSRRSSLVTDCRRDCCAWRSPRAPS